MRPEAHYVANAGAKVAILAKIAVITARKSKENDETFANSKNKRTFAADYQLL